MKETIQECVNMVNVNLLRLIRAPGWPARFSVPKATSVPSKLQRRTSSGERCALLPISSLSCTLCHIGRYAVCRNHCNQLQSECADIAFKHAGTTRSTCSSFCFSEPLQTAMSVVSGGFPSNSTRPPRKTERFMGRRLKSWLSSR